ncbi:MAG: sigma-70 family RNA polymerase sigma factor [Verrucomicrobiales bacterium]|nr:sigma-70 family RNA polymerase sigma factor [Verrucomicrobiales bacterium]
MTSLEDRELLRQYAEQASAPAFDEMVRRHLDHVYSAAMRRVNGERTLAEDVVQTVFIDFARKAKNIPGDMPPGAWLHRHTGFIASKMIDKEHRRRHREQEAHTMNTIETNSHNTDWASTAPLLDAAMDSLSSADRDAIVLRFFEKRDFRSVGEALGTSDDTAQKRVSRAVDKLRTLLGKRGITSTSGALAALMVANSVQAAPERLANQISAASLAGAATAGSSGTLGGALAGLEMAARLKIAAAAIGLVATAGFAGSRLFTAPTTSTVLPNAVSTAAVESSPPEGEPTASIVANAEPMDVEALITAAAAEWKGGREGVAASATALGYISKVLPEHMEKALEIASKLGDRPAATLVTKNLLTHWAESHPFQALAWAQSGGAAGSQPQALPDGLLKMWAGGDPRALLNFVSKASAGSVRHSPLSESVIGTIFRTTAEKDPALALSDLRRLFTPTERSQALRGIFDTVQNDDQRATVARQVEKLKNDEIRVQARRSMIEHWARKAPSAAARYVEKAEPAWERTRLMDSLGMTWLQADPSTAAEWWVTHAPGPDTLVKVINIWSQTDPNAAGKWLAKQDPGPPSDAARMTFARQVADLDPESALRWAETVSDASMREGTIDHVFAGWHVRNATAANTFLQSSGWPKDRLTRLQVNSNK